MEKSMAVSAFIALIDTVRALRKAKEAALCCSVLSICILAMGCVSLSGIVRTDSVPNRTKAYLLGVFELTRVSGGFGVAISVINEAGKRYHLKFVHEGNTCYAIEIEPGRYSFEKMYMYGLLNQSMSEKKLEAAANTVMANGFTAHAGEIVYIGEYTSNITKMRSFKDEIYIYRIGARKENFQERKKWFIQMYPKFSDLKFMNALKK